MLPLERVLWNRRIRARDGVELAANVILPSGGGAFPAVVLRTPYMRSRWLNSSTSWVRLVDYGYALITVDMRGRNDSGGEWIPWAKDLHDGHDVVEWVAAQPWCTGKVGMVGASYEGLSQWWTVADRPKHLACIAPLCSGRVRQALPFGTGIPSQYRLWWLALVLGKTQQFSGAPAWETWMQQTPLNALDESLGLSRSWWQEYLACEVEPASDALSEKEYASIDIPVLIGVGWWDDQGSMHAWQAMQRSKAANECRLLIGAWDHVGNVAPRPVLGGLDVSASVMDTVGYVERFLALHLKEDRAALTDIPRCRVFLTGKNCWDELNEWPHPRAVETALFLTSDGNACGLRGTGRLVNRADLAVGSDTYIYDPNHPGREMSNLSMFIAADPPLDVRYLQRRSDSLVYSSEVLREPLMVSGRYRLCVFIASDRPDTDLYVGLSDVHPNGRAISLAATNMQQACLRLSYRNGPEPEMLEPGKVYEVIVDGSWVHHVFKVGHKIRVAVSSGNFPVATRNAGTGEHWAEARILYPQINTIHHSPARPSRVLLPIVASGTH